MDDQEQVVIITMRQADNLPTPASLGETYTDQTCDECGALVYVTSTSFDRIREDGHSAYRIICNVCAKPYIEEAIEDPEDELIAADRRLEGFIKNNRSEVLAWMLEQSVTSNAEDE